jgi:hypothetical protein
MSGPSVTARYRDDAGCNLRKEVDKDFWTRAASPR